MGVGVIRDGAELAAIETEGLRLGAVEGSAADLDGIIIGLRRMQDSTVFSFDCGGVQSKEHGVLQQRHSNGRGFERSADGNGSGEPDNQFWRAAALSAGN